MIMSSNSMIIIKLLHKRNVPLLHKGANNPTGPTPVKNKSLFQPLHKSKSEVLSRPQISFLKEHPILRPKANVLKRHQGQHMVKEYHDIYNYIFEGTKAKLKGHSHGLGEI